MTAIRGARGVATTVLALTLVGCAGAEEADETQRVGEGGVAPGLDDPAADPADDPADDPDGQ